jgi:hypothetical protein
MFDNLPAAGVQSYSRPSSTRDPSLPRETDKPDLPNALPPPELNPLMNPVLGQHLDRWAEVYFMSPPQQREQAVRDLLRELEAGDAQVADGQPKPGCPSCGRTNPTSYVFCSACGTRLHDEGATPDTRLEDFLQAVPAGPNECRESEGFPLEDAVEKPPPRQSESLPAGPDQALGSAEASSRDDHPGHDYPSDDGRWALRSRPALHSYRVYVGGALALLFVALIYMAWRGRQTTAESSPVTTPVTRPSGPASQPTAPVPSAGKSRTLERRATPGQESVVSSHGAAGKLSDQALAGPGAEELAIALSFLNGPGDKERKSAEAVEWLWKAVAKRNADATLRLSDLFLKGDGVPKNCDQARVLLDAAARKRVKGADERLRHLRSFGCD